MERMTAADAWFLYLESPTVHLHVTGLLLLDPSTAPTRWTFATLQDHVAARLDRLPMMRRRAIEVPFGIDHACWIEDPDFDIDHHIRHRALRGGDAALAELVGEFASTPLDRGRPLWEMQVVDRPHGQVALLMKMHHCIVDGVTGMDVLAQLLDVTPAPSERHPEPFNPERVPSSIESLATASWHRLATPLRPLHAALDITTSLARMAGTTVGRRVVGAPRGAHPLNAPRTIVNGTITARRSVAFHTQPLEDFRTIAHAFDVKINDVVLAACTAGLRSYLSDRDDLPDRPLVCSIPVSTHGHDRTDASANQVSDMFVHLPVQLADPVERLRSIHEGCIGAKEMHGRVGPNVIGDVVELVPPPLFETASRLYSTAHLADRLPPVHNLVVSNVVGVPVPLYLAGAEVTAMYPFGPLMEGTGLNITVASSNGRMHLGLIACPDLVDDPDEIIGGMVDGVTALADAADAL